jgi:energy-converting hydrogenase B subunit Q
MPAYAVLTTVSNQPGILFGLTRVLADRQANISYVDIIPHLDRDAEIYLEFAVDGAIEPIVEALRMVPGVSAVEATPSFSKIYGKRIVIMGGGAQVGQVALGAITEADRHNIRGERISVDTIPLVGEEALAARSAPWSACRVSGCWCSPDRSWAVTSRVRSRKCAPRA